LIRIPTAMLEEPDAAKRFASTPGASIQTFNDPLEAGFAVHLQRVAVWAAEVVSRLDELLIQLAPFLERAAKWAREATERLERLPAVPGYEPFLIERGDSPLAARMSSYFVINLSSVAVTEVRMERRVIEAIRFLAKPGRSRRGVSRRVETLLRGWDGSSSLRCIRKEDISIHQLTWALEAFARGEPGACELLRQTAAAMAPRLAVHRGPKPRQASIGHELFLSLTGSAGYTWDPGQEDFIDPRTRATRLAFRDPDFDPRPAHRRERQRLRTVSTL
jgi:hypothetical protein